MKRWGLLWLPVSPMQLYAQPLCVLRFSLLWEDAHLRAQAMSLAIVPMASTHRHQPLVQFFCLALSADSAGKWGTSIPALLKE